MVLTNAAGFCVFGIASGLAILRGAALPKWLGWLAILIGVLVVAPAEFVGVLLLVVWIVSVSVLMIQRSDASPEQRADEAASA